MSKINLLNQETIDKIAAGEVIERPSSVVKELVENAIDAGSTAITVEIKEGGISFIRITDNGCGIAQDEVSLAFLRHSTSKIKSAEDLLCVRSLGFRGEALSSIAAIARVELITKTAEALTGTRYQIEGSREISVEEIGAPDGTTFLVRDLFFNTPARRKFLKTPQTEGTYISDMLEKLALSHPDISFKYINNNQTRLHTSGNGNRKDLIYHIYGRDIAASLMEVQYEGEYFSMSGYIGKPVINRGNRNYENYFINGRYIKSVLLSKAIEEAYKSFLMQHQYPFTVLYFRFPGDSLDVNVHPTKMELRFENNQEIYKELCEAIYEVLSHKELIPDVPIVEAKNEKKPLPVYKEPIPEPFEKRRINQIRSTQTYQPMPERKTPVKEENISYVCSETVQPKRTENPAKPDVSEQEIEETTQVTLESVSPEFLTKDARKKHRIIGQLFQTYWLIEYEDKLYIIDQHAAHEKVLYERTMARLKEKEFTSQTISPPIVLSLNAKEEEMMEKYMPQIQKLGYEVESFGGREYMISAVPDNLFHIDMKDLFIEMLDDFSNLTGRQTPDLILEKVASMSCKAAVKGNSTLSFAEIDALVEELLTLENPFHCPHGRPTIISMSKSEIEKKFKRII
ncbi:MAG: DNA mismatch repair endonuclease MutL [Lachnospiraceae bacterium]|nr:DNA mismatch repair endonuclease MutL [Lachnospiraceae bacterium]